MPAATCSTAPVSTIQRWAISLSTGLMRQCWNATGWSWTTADSCQHGLFRDERNFAANREPTSSHSSLSIPLGTSIMNVLVIDVGGTNVKILATGEQEPVKFPSGPTMTAKAMVAGVKQRTRDWKYDV